MISATPRRGSQRPDPVLAGAPMLVIFAFMMGVVLTIVFPTGREYAEVTSKQRVDAYSIAYLNVLTRANPNDSQLRFVYLRHLAELGRWEEAIDILSKAPPEVQGSADARALRLELMLAQARSLSEGDPDRTRAFEAIHGELEKLEKTAPPARLGELAKLALELEDPALGARFYLALAKTEPAVRIEALAEAGKWLRASGDGAGAADAYRRAAEGVSDPARHAELLSAAADALEASSGACPAAALLGPIAATSIDVALVSRAARLMTACGRAADAKVLGRKLVTLSHDEEEEQKRQIRRELAAGDAAGALAILRLLLTKHPQDIDLHDATAKVAEWAGQPHVALEQWLWLLDMGRGPGGPLKLP